jgi:hypothetical protein
MKKQLTLITLLSITCFTGFSQKKKKVAVESAPVVAAVDAVSPTSAIERMAGYEQRKKLQEASIVKNLKFRNVGPTIMSGRIVDIDANPENPTEFYAAYASGGLWYTVNNGQSFSPIFDNEAVMTIGDIAVDWKTHTDRKSVV